MENSCDDEDWQEVKVELTTDYPRSCGVVGSD